MAKVVSVSPAQVKRTGLLPGAKGHDGNRKILQVKERLESLLDAHTTTASLEGRNEDSQSPRISPGLFSVN